MGVYIKGLKMPEDCMFCPAFKGDWGMCGVLVQATVIAGKHPDCPLVEVPSHGRLIDADALNKKAVERSEKLGELVNVMDKVLCSYDIQTAPTIIPASEEK